VEHLSQQTISDFRERRLSPDQLLAVDRHLSDCEQCHRLLYHGREDSISELYDKLITSDPAIDDHLNYEMLEMLVDNKVTDVDREIANLHLSTCSRCTSDLQALSELREQRPVMVLDRRSFRSFFNFSWPRLAFAALAVLFVAGLSWFIWRSQQSSVESNQIATSATPSPTPASSAIGAPSVLPSPEIVVSLNDAGGLITLDTNGKIEGIGELPTALSNSVKKALGSGQIDIDPTLAGLRGKGGTLMGGSSETTPFSLLSPVGVVVESDRPTFKWNAYEGATAYVVKVFDSDFNQVATSLSQTATSWNVPMSLRRGTTYTWQVTASKLGADVMSPVAPAPQPRFRVLAEDRLNEINKVRTTKPTSHLVLGNLYAQAGLLEEARHEFRMLLKRNPRSRLTQKLLDEVSRQ
jgi:hypothetical protein